MIFAREASANMSSCSDSFLPLFPDVYMYDLTQVLFLAGNVTTHTLKANQIHSATDIRKTLGLITLH